MGGAAEQEGIKVILYITAPHAQNQEPVTEPLELERTEMELKTIQQLAERIKPHAVVPVALGIRNIQQSGTDLTFRYANDGLYWSSDFHQPFDGHVPPTYDGRRRHNC